MSLEHLAGVALYTAFMGLVLIFLKGKGRCDE